MMDHGQDYFKPGPFGTRPAEIGYLDRGDSLSPAL